MSPENSSASCTAMESGMFESSVAANSELRITPPARRLVAASGADSRRELKSSPVRSTTRRLNWPLSSGAQRAVRRTKRWSSVVSAVMERPLRPRRFWCTLPSLRSQAAAAGSATPRRCSKDSAVSLLRSCSLRYSVKPGCSVNCASVVSLASDCTGMAMRCCGRSAASGPSEATAKAPPPAVSKSAARAAVRRLGWLRRLRVRFPSTARLASVKPLVKILSPGWRGSGTAGDRLGRGLTKAHKLSGWPSGSANQAAKTGWLLESATARWHAV